MLDSYILMSKNITVSYKSRENMTIKLLRQMRNFTQETLAKQLECKQTSISKYEKGVSMPKIEQLPRIAEILNCSIEDVVLALIETKNQSKEAV